MSAEQNKAVIRRWVEFGWNKGDVSIVDDILDPTYMIHDPSDPKFAGGIPAFKAYVTNILTGLPDLQFTIDDMLAEGDKVVWRFAGHGTHTGSLMGLPPTGKKGTVTGIIITRFTAAGKIVEDWINWDTLGLLQQIGVIPSLA